MILTIAAGCWCQCKHTYTVKHLTGITPNGVVSYLSDSYGSRATDVIIIQDCGFLQGEQPRDYVMADRRFKIQDMFAFYQCSLLTVLSKHAIIQMTTTDARKISRMAQVKIYVELPVLHTFLHLLF